MNDTNATNETNETIATNATNETNGTNETNETNEAIETNEMNGISESFADKPKFDNLISESFANSQVKLKTERMISFELQSTFNFVKMHKVTAHTKR